MNKKKDITMDWRKPCLGGRHMHRDGREGDRLCTKEKEGEYLFYRRGAKRLPPHSVNYSKDHLFTAT
jgi:hypothetical protein